MKKQVSVIIPNFNGRNYLKDCLNSLNQQHFQDFEIILVDNASTDDSLSLAREFCPEIKTIVLSENFGFCRAVNEGIRASKTPFVLLLNNDTVVDPDFVGALYEAIRGKEKVFSCASQMRKLTDPSKMDDGGDFYCALGWAFARGKDKPYEDYEKAGRIFFSNVVCLLIRLAFVFFAIPQIGMQGYLWGILASQLVLAGIYFFCLYHFFRKH